MNIVILIHTISIIIPFFMGLIIFFNKKGTRNHKIFGWIFVISMTISLISSFFIKLQGHFSFIHILSIFGLFWLYQAIIAILLKKVNWLYKHIIMILSAYISIISAGTGVIIRHFILPNNVTAGMIGSFIVAIISIPIVAKIAEKYKK